MNNSIWNVLYLFNMVTRLKNKKIIKRFGKMHSNVRCACDCSHIKAEAIIRFAVCASHSTAVLNAKFVCQHCEELQSSML